MKKSKKNKRGQNAVYTANDCFSDGLDNMEQGKCYALNPDRGTQYGWINNNAQDRWWWKEVACGGESSDSNGCPENFSPLFKKSIFNDSSDNSDKNASYEIWGNKTQFFYDALGRKTQARPETRRYLFEKKNKLLKEQDYLQFGTISFKQESIIEGEVKVEHYYEAKHAQIVNPKNCDCSNVCFCPTNFKILFSFSTTIKDVIHHNDPLLEFHENKHVEIYNSLGNAKWEKNIQINYCKSYEQICSEFKAEVKSEYEKRLKTLIVAQNKWDDDDENNISHKRINLQEKIDEMYQRVNMFNCPNIR